ncbi:hypothetical protein Amn_31010 [Aminobacter sp. Y103A]|nr:hypothetical protein Amn_31010 [Aminobacter sp. SS-2016]
MFLSPSPKLPNISIIRAETSRRSMSREPSRPTPVPFTDEYGVECLRVALDRQGRRHALVEAGAYRQVLDAGATAAWFLNANSQGREYVRTYVPDGTRGGTLVQVARVVVGAGAKSVIRYSNGDTLDLRSGNLLWERGRAKRNDTALAHQSKALRLERGL